MGDIPPLNPPPPPLKSPFFLQASPREKYIKLMPALQQLFGVLEPNVAYAALRPGLTPFARGKAPIPKTEGKVTMVATPEETDLQKQLMLSVG